MSTPTVPFHRRLGTRALLLAVLPTVAILLGIIIYTSVRMSREARDEAERSLRSLAQNVAAEVERSNAQAVLAAQVMAAAQESAGLFGRREESVAYARRILETNPDFTAAYFGYEPDADGQDARYRQESPGSAMASAHDEAGRFLPYWYRGLEDDAQILLTPLVDMEASLYYQGVKDVYLERGPGHPMVTEPYVYEGKMIVEHTHPIALGGEFRGIAGIDRALTDITDFVRAIERRTGVGIFLISRAGRFIATTTPEEGDLITRDVTETVYADLFGPFLADRTQAFFELDADPADDELYYYATAPVETGTWTVVVRELEAEVAAPIRENLLYNVIIAVAGVLVVVGLSLWTTASITRRVGMAVDAADTVACGDLAARVELETDGGDEVALLLGSLRRMVESLEAKMRAIDAIAAGNYATRVEPEGEGDALGRSLQAMAASLRQIVEHTSRIAEGDYAQLLEPRSQADELAQSLNRMTRSLADARDRLEQRVQQRTDELQEYAGQLEERSQELQRLGEEAQARADEEASLAALTAHLQGNLTVAEVAQRALDEVVEFLGVTMGAVYVPEEDGRLHRRAGHALPPEAEETASLRPGSGSVGQAAQSRQAATLQVGAEAWPISLGLMRVTPKLVMTLPLVANEALAGVVELYLLEELDPQQLRWLTKAGEIFAVALRLAAESREREVAEEQTRLILDSSGEALFGLDTEGRATFVNPVACQLLGYEAEELIGEQMHAMIHHSHADGSPYAAAGCPMREAFTEGVVTRVDDEVLWRKDGSAMPVEYTSTPILKDGQILGAVISCRDVTEQREAAKRLAAREAQFRNLLDSAPDAMVISDGDGEITMVNRQTETLFGYGREELVGQRVEMLMPERFRGGHPEKREAFMGEGQPRPMGGGLELWAVTKDGREFPIEVSLSPIETDEGSMVSSAVRDISQRWESERRDSLLARLREAVWQLDADSAVADLLEPLRAVLDDSGVGYQAFGVNLVESEGERRVRIYTAGPTGFREEVLEPVHAAKVVEFWRGGEIVNRRDLWSADDLQELETWESPTGRKGPRSIVDVPFSHGTLAANSLEADGFTPHLDLLAAIAGVLSEGFRRLDDLKARRGEA